MRADVRKIMKSKVLPIEQVVLGVFQQILTIYLAYLISLITDATIAGNTQKFYQIMPMLFCILLLEMLIRYGTKKVTITRQADYAYELREKIYQKVVNDADSDDERKSNILNIYNIQIEQITPLVLQNAQMIISTATLAASVVYMCTISPELLVASLIFVPLSSHLNTKLMHPLQKQNQYIQTQKQQLNQMIKDNLDGFYIVRAFLLKDFFRKKYEHCIEGIRNKEKEKDKILSFLSRVGILLRYMPQLIVPLYGGWLTFSKEMSVGQLVAANTVIWYVILPIEEMIGIYKTQKAMQPVMDNIDSILQKEVCDSIEPSVSPKTLHTIEVKNLCFAYQGENVLQGLNLKISKGEHILLMGDSGCGKSTLSKILCGMEKNFEGTIRINDEKLENNDFSRIVYIPQEPYLFAASIKENICMGREVTKSRLQEALRVSGVDEFISRFPEAMDTMIGEGGALLSGGQKKRIAIARAILTEGDLYILDEPTASLDRAGAGQLMEYLSAFWKEKSMLIISHTIKDMPDVDAVYRLRRGGICNE